MSNEQLKAMIYNLAASSLVSKAESEILRQYLETGRNYKVTFDGRIIRA
jgi:hypothetical protein